MCGETNGYISLMFILNAENGFFISYKLDEDG